MSFGTFHLLIIWQPDCLSTSTAFKQRTPRRLRVNTQQCLYAACFKMKSCQQSVTAFLISDWPSVRMWSFIFQLMPGASIRIYRWRQMRQVQFWGDSIKSLRNFSIQKSIYINNCCQMSFSFSGYTKVDVGWGFAQDPNLGELTASPRPRSWFQRGRFAAGGKWRGGED